MIAERLRVPLGDNREQGSWPFTVLARRARGESVRPSPLVFRAGAAVSVADVTACPAVLLRDGVLRT